MDEQFVKIIKESGMSEYQTMELLQHFVRYQRQGGGWLWSQFEDELGEVFKPVETQLEMFEGVE